MRGHVKSLGQDDQGRTTVTVALENGASYFVIGDPVSVIHESQVGQSFPAPKERVVNTTKSLDENTTDTTPGRG